MVSDLFVDASDTLWVLTRRALFRLEAQALSAVEVPLIEPRFTEIVRGPSGEVALVHEGGVLRRSGDQWTPEVIPMPTGPGPNELATVRSARYAPSGALVIGTDREAWVVRDGVTTPFVYAAHGIDCRRVYTLAVDGRDRIWLSTDAGIGVIANGERVAFWPLGSVTALGEDIVEDMLPVGNGPTLPTGLLGALHRPIPPDSDAE